MSHITLAASANTFNQIFDVAEKKFSFNKQDGGSWGPFSASYSVAAHLNGGGITLNKDNTVEISNVQVVWDALKVQVCFNLPGFCVGGFCILPSPWGCIVHAPKICVGGPVCIGPDFSGLVSLIQDVKAGLNAVYFVSPQRTAGQSDLDAEFAGYSNQWKIFLNPTLVDVQPIDIPATIDNMIENLVKQAIDDAFLSWLPGWAQDLVWDVLGPLLDLFNNIIGIVGNLTDWFTNLLGNVFGLVPLIETAVAQYFASQYPLYSFEDPYPILPGSQSPGSLIPVKIPIRNLAAVVNSSEMVVTADVGV
jgi:hypothetical protein